MASPLNTSMPNVARMYDYLLGGKDNFEADRVAVRNIMEIESSAPAAARMNRAFLRRAVRFLVGDAGIRQFIDIGSGLPTADNVHEVAQSLAPTAKIVYVDNDPVVLSHSRALLASSPEGKCAYAESDIRDTGGLIAEAAKTLDFSRPVAILLIAVLHFIPDKEDPWGVVRDLMAAVPPGSFLAVSHATSDYFKDAADKDKLNAVYAQTAPGGVTPRPLPDIWEFFSGLVLEGPGIVDVCAWRPIAERPRNRPSGTLLYGGLARKP